MPISFKGPVEKPWFPPISPIATIFGLAKIEPRFPARKGRRPHADITEALVLEVKGRSRPQIHQALGKADSLQKRRLSDAMRQRKVREKRRVAQGLPGRDEE